MCFQLKMPATYPCTRIMIMLLILLMANNLLMGQFRACQKINFLFSEHTLTRTWLIALLGLPSLPLTPPFFLNLCLIEICGYALTTEISTTSRLRTGIFSPWSASPWIGFAGPNNLQSWILKNLIIKFVSKKVMNGKPLFELITAIISTASCL